MSGVTSVQWEAAVDLNVDGMGSYHSMNAGGVDAATTWGVVANYSRTGSASFAGIQPRKSFGRAAYIQSPRVLKILISLPGGKARTLLAVSAVASRACTSLPVTIASARPSLLCSSV